MSEFLSNSFQQLIGLIGVGQENNAGERKKERDVSTHMLVYVYVFVYMYKRKEGNSDFQ